MRYEERESSLPAESVASASTCAKTIGMLLWAYKSERYLFLSLVHGKLILQVYRPCENQVI